MKSYIPSIILFVALGISTATCASIVGEVTKKPEKTTVLASNMNDDMVDTVAKVILEVYPEYSNDDLRVQHVSTKLTDAYPDHIWFVTIGDSSYFSPQGQSYLHLRFTDLLVYKTFTVMGAVCS